MMPGNSRAFLSGMTESVAENIPPFGVRVKWRGKSPPLFWQQKGHDKPHQEQDQAADRVSRLLTAGRLLKPAGNSRIR